MQCIFLDSETKGYCSATNRQLWTVDEETIKKFCKIDGFEDCPRFKAYMELQEKSSTLKLKQK